MYYVTPQCQMPTALMASLELKIMKQNVVKMPREGGLKSVTTMSGFQSITLLHGIVQVLQQD